MTSTTPHATPSRGAPDRRGNLPPKRPAGPLSPAERREWVKTVPLGSSGAWKYPPRRHYERIKRKRNAFLWAAIGGAIGLVTHHYFTFPPF